MIKYVFNLAMFACVAYKGHDMGNGLVLFAGAFLMGSEFTSMLIYAMRSE